MNAERALKQAGDILKARWPEVLLITAMQVGLMVLLERVMVISRMGVSHQGAIPDWAMFVLGAGSMLMAVVWQMLYLGFLRSAALNGPAPHEPMTLLLTGRGFFWRFLGVQIVLGILLSFVGGMLAALLGWFTGSRDASSFPPWLTALGGVAAMAVFLKPFFLIPGFMLALNASVGQSVVLMRQFRLGDLGAILKGYALGLTVIAAAAVSAALAPAGSPVYYMAAGVSYLIQSVTVLALLLATVLYLVPAAKPDTEEDQ